MTTNEARESLLQQATAARWIIAVHIQVDGQFQAFARKPGHRADEVLPQIDVNEDWQGNISLERTSIGKPGQCATAATPEAAIGLLCERLLGLSP